MSDLNFSNDDCRYMQHALDLAKQGRFTTTPNPAVGCVIVNNNQIVGQGFHHKVGEPHAEIIALQQAGKHSQNATVYVTLEPCNHYGKTPPCTHALIHAGVKKVIAAIADPNPAVAGKGFKKLTEANVDNQVGLLQSEAENINQGFLKRMRTGKPYVQLKMAMSIDGKTATATGESKWITSQESRQDVQQYRAQACAILSASGTVLVDDPLLNFRWHDLPEETQLIYPQQAVRQPVRIIMDSKHRIRPHHKLFTADSPIWLVSSIPRDMTAFPDFCQEIQLTVLPEQTQLEALMIELGKRQINNLWVESGANLAGSLISEELVDELIVYIAPKLLGDQARGLCHLPNVTQLDQAPHWKTRSINLIGDDIKIVYT